MEQTVNIISEFWAYVEKEKEESKTAQKVYDWLNGDNLGAIILDRGVYWVELTHSYATFPNYAYDFLKKWAKSQGYQYLYDNN